MKRLLHLAFLSSAIIFSSCQLFTSFNEPVKQYFDDLTNSAKIDSYKLPSDYVYATDSSGNTCIPSSAVASNGSLTVSLTLMNPQRFTIEPSVSFSSLAEGIDSSNVTIEKGDDCYTLLLNLPKLFLTSVDENSKKLSTTIGIKTTVSGVERTFENYSMDLNCNSVPPEIYDAVIYIDDSNNYVICFNLPSQSLLSSIHKDISTLTVNGTSYNLTIAADGSASFADTSLNVYTSANTSIETDTVTFTNADNKTVSFKKNNVTFAVAGQPAYFMTSDPLSEDDKTYTLTLTDNAGLSSTVATSVQAIQLGSITLSKKDGTAISSGEKIEQDEGSSYASIIFTPAATASNESDTSDSIIIYEAYEGTDDTGASLYNGKNSGGELTLKVPSGKIYLRVHAHKDMFADSSVYEYNLQILKSTLFVSSAGSDSTGNGSENKPYATISNAISQFTDKTSSKNNITLLTDITENISITDATTSVKLIGKGHTVTGSVTNAGTLTATNVTFTDSITNSGSISLTDATVSGDISNTGTLLEFDGSTTVRGTVTLAKDCAITIGTLAAEKVATITLKDYTESNVVLKANTAHAEVTQEDCNKFSVNANANIKYSVVPSGTNGILAKNGVTSIVAFPTDYTADASLVNGSALLTTDVNTIKSGDEITFTVACKNKTVSPSYTLLSILSNGSTFLTASSSDGTYPTLTVPASMPAGAYSLKMIATIEGNTYSAEISLEVE